MSTGAIGPLDQALLPEQVRRGGPAAQKAYTAALGFEQMLVQQLSQSITDSAGSTDGLGGSDTSSSSSGDGSGDDTSGLGGASDPSASPYASLLSDALTQGIMNAGGLGLAQQLAPSLQAGASAGTGSGSGTGTGTGTSTGTGR